jgi:hypothetical protein
MKDDCTQCDEFQLSLFDDRVAARVHQGRQEHNQGGGWFHGIVALG